MILLFTNTALGDNLYTQPILDTFLEKGEKVLLFTTQKQLYRNYKDRVLLLDRNIRLVRIFVKFVLTHLVKSVKLGYNTDQNILEGYYHSANLVPPKNLTYPQPYLSEEEKQRFRYPQKTVVLNVSSVKNIPHRGVYGINWEQVVDFLKAKGFDVVELGLHKTISNCELLNTKDNIDLLAAIYNCTYFLGLDSGPAHIAACFKKPSILIMGPVIPSRRHLLNDFNGLFLQNPCEFAGCFHLETKGYNGQPCRLLNTGLAHICCTFTQAQIEKTIEALIKPE